MDRKHFIFEVTKVSSKNSEILSAIRSLLDFCNTRQAISAIIHPDKKVWKEYQPNAKLKVDFYTSLFECQDHFRKQLLPNNEGPKSNEPKKASEQRKLALEKLIAEYKKKVVKKSYDPYELDTAAQRYKKQPNKDDLKSLESAITNYFRLKSENEAATTNIVQLAEQAKTLILLRKKAVAPEEIVKRRNELMILKRLAEVEIEILRINNG